MSFPIWYQFYKTYYKDITDGWKLLVLVLPNEISAGNNGRGQVEITLF